MPTEMVLRGLTKFIRIRNLHESLWKIRDRDATKFGPVPGADSSSFCRRFIWFHSIIRERLSFVAPISRQCFELWIISHNIMDLGTDCMLFIQGEAQGPEGDPFMELARRLLSEWFASLFDKVKVFSQPDEIDRYLRNLRSELSHLAAAIEYVSVIRGKDVATGEAASANHGRPDFDNRLVLPQVPEQNNTRVNGNNGAMTLSMMRDRMIEGITDCVSTLGPEAQAALATLRKPAVSKHGSSPAVSWEPKLATPAARATIPSATLRKNIREIRRFLEEVSAAPEVTGAFNTHREAIQEVSAFLSRAVTGAETVSGEMEVRIREVADRLWKPRRQSPQSHLNPQAQTFSPQGRAHPAQATENS